MRQALPEPFAIGLRPIAEEDWLRPDSRRPAYVAEKGRLSDLDPSAVFAEAPGTRAAQVEVLSLIREWFTRNARSMTAPDGTGAPSPDPQATDAPPLLAAAMMLCEDLALMRRTPAGWTLVAGAIHFPSAWRLSEKIGRPMHEVHAPVPGYEARTRGARMIERIFDSLDVGTIVERANWSLHDEATLHLPRNPPDHERRLASAEPSSLTIRRERQTLRKLAGGDILFTIDVTVPSVDELTDGEQKALARQLRALDDRQRDYKGLTEAAGSIAEAMADVDRT